VARDVGAGAALGALDERLASREGLARQWGGGMPAGRVAAAARAAVDHPRDPAAARRAAAGAGGEPAFAGALVGLAAGADPKECDPGLLGLARPLSMG
jgi:hypothetical protein